MPHPLTSPLPEDRNPGNVQSDGPVDMTGKSQSSTKHSKKIKKHSKHDNSGNQVFDSEPVTKPKRHKKSDVDKTAPMSAYPLMDSQAPCELSSGSKHLEPVDTLVGEEEPVKKKKKRSKDHPSKSEKSKNKKTIATTSSGVTTDVSVTNDKTCITETSGSKPKSSNRSKDRNKSPKEAEDFEPNSSGDQNAHIPTVPQTDPEDRIRRHAPTDSSCTSLRHGSPEQEHRQCDSPRHSSHSSRFSSARSSSYSRSPSHRIPEKRNDVRSYREKYRDRGPRHRAPERSRSPDPRHFQPRRTYVAYRPPSAGRDSSYDDYPHESRPPRFRRSRSHSRSHGLSRHTAETSGRDYDVPQQPSRLRDLSPRRTYSRRHYRDEPDRGSRESPPRRPIRRDRHVEERRPRHELPTADNRHSRPYRSHERIRDDNFPNPEHTVMPEAPESRRDLSTEQPRHREFVRAADSERRITRAEKPHVSPSKCSTRPSTRSEHRSRDRDLSRKQRDSDSSKLERRARRPSVNEDRPSLEPSTPTESVPSLVVVSAGSRNKRSSTSRSPRVARRDSGPHKSHPQSSSNSASSSSMSSKLRPVHEHLDQLQFEAVSDTELESMLTPTVFLTASQAKDSRRAELADPTVGSHPLTESDQGENKDVLTVTSYGPSTVSEVSTDASKVTDVKNEETTALVLDTLDKISSQLKQKLAGAETWDTGTGSESEADIEDEAGLNELDDLLTDQSVIGLTTCKPGWSTRSRQLTASLLAPWQRLVASASKDPNSDVSAVENEVSGHEHIQPAVCVDTPLGSQRTLFPYRLVSLQNRSLGAACLARIGISKRFLGSELCSELTRLVREQLATEESSDELRVLPNPADNLGSHTCAWLDRTRDFVSSCGQELPRNWVEACANFGVLNGKSDHLLRRFLLQKTN
ncbi:hypothetical protein FGIG_11784 [Fasciola gigantica]|uniref:Uncharacterized protein n=1 Tax=Fasciola gigantica TaxID=46835 RepID=A0A504Z155_FASGI|nr:hypothetical protein FGIG_11784 [Fasciola gigantica]